LFNNRLWNDLRLTIDGRLTIGNSDATPNEVRIGSESGPAGTGPDLLSPPRCDPARPDEGAGERVGLAYDSATIMLRAVQTLGVRLRGDQRQRWNPRAITPVGVYTQIRRQNLERPFPGVTGAIRFDDTGEPVHKVIYLLRAKTIPDAGTDDGRWCSGAGPRRTATRPRAGAPEAPVGTAPPGTNPATPLVVPVGSKVEWTRLKSFDSTADGD